MPGLYGGGAILPVRRPRSMGSLRAGQHLSAGQPTTGPRVAVTGPAGRVGEMQRAPLRVSGAQPSRARRRQLGNLTNAGGPGRRYSPAVSVLL